MAIEVRLVGILGCITGVPHLLGAGNISYFDLGGSKMGMLHTCKKIYELYI